jgi:hypothetical protein
MFFINDSHLFPAVQISGGTDRERKSNLKFRDSHSAIMPCKIRKKYTAKKPYIQGKVGVEQRISVLLPKVEMYEAASLLKMTGFVEGKINRLEHGCVRFGLYSRRLPTQRDYDTRRQ